MWSVLKDLNKNGLREYLQHFLEFMQDLRYQEIPITYMSKYTVSIIWTMELVCEACNTLRAHLVVKSHEVDPFLKKMFEVGYIF